MGRLRRTNCWPALANIATCIISHRYFLLCKVSMGTEEILKRLTMSCNTSLSNEHNKTCASVEKGGFRSCSTV